jgi:hypothetical protein
VITTTAQCCQAVVKPRIRVHLHFQEHHRKLGAACFGATSGLAWPEHAIKAVAQLFDFEGFKAVEAVPGFVGVKAQDIRGGG